MNSKFKIVLALTVGMGIGAAAVQGLHAQAKPKAYRIVESELLDQAALAAVKNITPQRDKAIKIIRVFVVEGPK